MDTTKVFVYGTLRRGEYNHPLLMGAKFLGTDTLPNHALYSLRYFPAAVYCPNSSVVGEVYEVDSEHLTRLDTLEGYTGDPATSLYLRKELTLASGTKAHVYVWPRQPDKNMSLIPSGDWLDK